MAAAVWWGWHQLTDAWARDLVAAAGVDAGDLVLDVGAGRGALTAPLLRAGAHVIAVEWHPARAAYLRRRYAGKPVTVVQCDASDLRLPRRPFRVVANPPFAVTTALLRRLLSAGSRMTSGDLVVPRHVAARWAAGRGPGTAVDIRVVRHVPQSAFYPSPPDAAAVIRITRTARAKASDRAR